jgi:chemotaxis protein methyltransferase WspC
MSEGPTRVVERLLAERIGLDPSSVGDALIARGVQNRMAALGLGSRAEYDQTLREREGEIQALVEEVVVPESWFFRDDRPFEVLTGFARLGWAGDRERPPLTALSLPCAGGEEPYSIAITLLEAGLPADRFRVDAVDVSGRSLARAIAGVYGANAFRGVGSPARSGYFREESGAFTVAPMVRPCVRFHLGNLLDPTLFADRPGFDAVFCRNLLIYLDDAAKSRAFATLARLVADGGLLFLGHADRLDAPEAAPFEPTADRGAFAYRKVGVGVGAKAEAAVPPRVPRPTSPARPPLLTMARGRSTEPRRSPPPPIVAPSPSPRPEARPPVAPIEAADAALDRASALADSGGYAEATALVEGVIARGGAGARAYFLLGLIAQAAGDRDRAERHLLKAIYLDPQHDEALLALALLARRKGDIAGESAYRKRAERVLARKTNP